MPSPRQTLKASPLSNLGCAVPQVRADRRHDPDGVAAAGADGAPPQGAFVCSWLRPGVHAALVPPGILSVDAFSVLLVVFLRIIGKIYLPTMDNLSPDNKKKTPDNGKISLDDALKFSRKFAHNVERYFRNSWEQKNVSRR